MMPAKTLILAFGLAAAAAAQTPAPPAAPAAPPERPVAPSRTVAPRGPVGPRGRGERGGDYDRGTRALDRSQWEEARQIFSSIAQGKGSRADGALYWQAYAENRLGRRNEALATLASLRQQYPSSDWQNDAEALAMEIRQQAGKPVDPNAASDEEMKLMAINVLINTDAERAVPLLEKILKSASSPRLKDKALFVLSQSRAPKAQQLLVSIAKGGSNPDLQLSALNYIGMSGNKDAAANIAEVYKSSRDMAVKKKALNGLMIAHASDALMTIARTEQDADLRKEAINYLAILHENAKLAELYQAGIARESVVDSLFLTGDVNKVLDIARTEKDPKLRSKAIHSLGLMGNEQARAGLVSLYSAESDQAVKQQIINALFMQGSAKSMVEIARKESNPEMKRDIVRRLSMMNSKEATEYLMELLK
jgi:HEAT repeat protein